jgi:hypothetical protein
MSYLHFQQYFQSMKCYQYILNIVLSRIKPVKFHKRSEWNEQEMQCDFGKFDCFCNFADVGTINPHYIITSNASEHICVTTFLLLSIYMYINCFFLDDPSTTFTKQPSYDVSNCCRFILLINIQKTVLIKFKFLLIDFNQFYRPWCLITAYHTIRNYNFIFDNFITSLECRTNEWNV